MSRRNQPDRYQPKNDMAGMNRRSFLASSGKTAALAATLARGGGSLRALASGAQFPAKFAWGAATSAMQVEGYPYEDGGGRSVWFALDHDPARVKDGSNMLVADDTYHRWAADIPLMRQIGLNSYRLSISWPRVLPDGRGAVNTKALDYYDRLLDGLLHAGITPWVTVYHFDYPEALQQQGGWLHQDSPQWLADYAHLLSARYSDRVSHWLTINEPNIFWTFSSEAGMMPPFAKLPREQLALGAHHILLGHGRSVQAIRAAAKKPVQVGMPFAGQMSLPSTESPADIAAARTWSFTVQAQMLLPNAPPLSMIGNAWWLDPVYLGRYPQEGFQLFPGAEKLATPEAMAAIHQPLDFCAVNLYFGPHVRAGAAGQPEVAPEPADAPRTHYGWTINPELLYWGQSSCMSATGKPSSLPRTVCRSPANLVLTAMCTTRSAPRSCATISAITCGRAAKVYRCWDTSTGRCSTTGSSPPASVSSSDSSTWTGRRWRAT